MVARVEVLKGKRWVYVMEFETKVHAERWLDTQLADDAANNLFRMWRIKDIAP